MVTNRNKEAIVFKVQRFHKFTRLMIGVRCTPVVILCAIESILLYWKSLLLNRSQYYLI